MGRIFEFVANSRDGVIAVDPHQRIVLWNEVATAILGFSSKDVLGTKCYEVLRGRDDEGCIVCRRDCGDIISARTLEPTATRDVAVRTKSGQETWINASTVVVPSRSGELLVLIYLFREVTCQHEVAAAATDLASLVGRQEIKSPKRAHSPPVLSDTCASHAPHDEVAGLKARSPKQARQPLAPPDSSLDLTPREHEILGYLKAGLSTKKIAKRLSISSRTVRNHVTNILSKLGVHSRLEAVTRPIENDLL